MNRPISPRGHGFIDYATVTAAAVVPRALGFPRRATHACDALAGGYAALSALTDYPLSLRRVIPFKAHGAAEAISAVALPALPHLLGFWRNRRARNFFLGLTAMTVMVAVLTDWDADD